MALGPFFVAVKYEAGYVYGRFMNDQPTIPMKYYHGENVNRFIVGPSKRQYSFTPYKLFAGVWRGVYRSDDEGEQAELDAMAADPKSGITSITAEEYTAKLQKKSGLVKDLKPIEPVKPQEPPVKVAASAAAVEASKAAESEARPKEVAVDEVSEVASVPMRRRGRQSAQPADQTPAVEPETSVE